MKKISIIFVITMVVASSGFAQFKEQLNNQPSVESSLLRPSEGLLFGFFDPAKLSMRQSLSMSYMSLGSQSIAVGMYTNSLSYKISDPLTLSADVSLINSPYNTLGSKFSQAFNGIYLTRAELNYHPSSNFQIDIQFNQNPMARFYNPYYYNPYYFSSPWGLYREPR